MRPAHPPASSSPSLPPPRLQIAAALRPTRRAGASGLSHRRRWFVLTAHALAYWLDEEGSASGQPPRGLARLRGASAHGGGGGGGPWTSDLPFSFVVEFPRESGGAGAQPGTPDSAGAAGAGGGSLTSGRGSRLGQALARAVGGGGGSGRLDAYSLAAESGAEYGAWLHALQQVRALLVRNPSVLLSRPF